MTSTAERTGNGSPQDLPPITSENQWTCRRCGRRWVVAGLARDCEAKHR